MTRPRVAYLVSWFPKLTETFVLFELLAVERQGVDVTLFPLRRARAALIHPEAAALLERVRFTPLLSPAYLTAHLYYLLRSPLAYLGSALRLLWANLGSRRYFFAAVAFFPKAVHLARLMQREGFGHVHAHFASHPAAVGWLIGRLTGIPYSFTAHGSDLHRDQHMLALKTREARFVVAISEYNRRLILEHAGADCADKVRVVHCGVPTGRLAPRPEPSMADGPRLVCVGTLHAVKGQRVLIEACAALVARGLELRCELIGEGPDREALERLGQQRGLADRLVFSGPLSHEEVLERLRAAHLLVAPSVPTADGRREGIPVALMEGMALGLPVVASDLSGIPELVVDGACGLLVPPGDAGALAEAIGRLAEDGELRRRLAAAGRARVAQAFDLDAEAAKLAALWTEPAER